MIQRQDNATIVISILTHPGVYEEIKNQQAPPVATFMPPSNIPGGSRLFPTITAGRDMMSRFWIFKN